VQLRLRKAWRKGLCRQKRRHDSREQYTANHSGTHHILIASMLECRTQGN